LIGFTEADVIHRYDAVIRFDIPHHITPQVGGGRIAMQEQKRIPGSIALVNVMQAMAVDAYELRCIGKFGGEDVGARIVCELRQR
tara:strand:+ start:416 stop:670 length:255 start_codon:yes stop_codon:yes gene_type:complete